MNEVASSQRSRLQWAACILAAAGCRGDESRASTGRVDGGADASVAPVWALEIVAGMPGSEGYLDGFGDAARVASAAREGAYDPSRRTYYFAQGYGGGGVVRALDVTTGEVSWIAGALAKDEADFEASDGPTSTARFGWSDGPVAIDTEKQWLYVATLPWSSPVHGGRIRVIDLEKREVTTLAGGPTEDVDGPPGVGGIGLGMAHVALDVSHHTLYINASCAVRSVDTQTGIITTLWGRLGFDECVERDGDAQTARFERVGAMAYDASRNRLYVSDGRDDYDLVSPTRVRVIDIATGSVSTLSGTKCPGYPPCPDVDGPPNAARLQAEGFAFDGANTLFVAEYGAIRSVDVVSGNVSTVAGQLNQLGSADGPRGYAELFLISGFALDAPTKEAFVVDYSYPNLIAGGYGRNPAGLAFGARARGIDTSSGEVRTIAGSLDNANAIDGIGARARFHEPIAIAWDGTTDVFVLERLDPPGPINTREAALGWPIVRRMDISTGSVTTLVRGGLADQFDDIAWDAGRKIVYATRGGTLFRIGLDGSVTRWLRPIVGGDAGMLADAGNEPQLPGAAWRIAYDSIHRTLYVLGSPESVSPSPTQVFAIDTETGETQVILSRSDVLANIAIERGSSRIYASYRDAPKVMIVDMDTRSTTDLSIAGTALPQWAYSGPTALGVDPDEHRLYLAFGQQVVAVDLDRRTIAPAVGDFQRVGVRPGPTPTNAANFIAAISCIGPHDILLTDRAENVVLRAR